eukprot:gnl/TRDRNA2_/TRDRNA2_154495_c0_seq1.p1 gnl/TRDRNA2_/TRDRNA2_154495_c0~~gnl/TRDRNA2_/TRDRNA2_154495_c0_seq1.p1  ORF type:complete len:128 (+),score=12.81 gnl/TRDRNA2_/TRDRNA2_154495_c0_seq1:248-631(+)
MTSCRPTPRFNRRLMLCTASSAPGDKARRSCEHWRTALAGCAVPQHEESCDSNCIGGPSALEEYKAACSQGDDLQVSRARGANALRSSERRAGDTASVSSTRRGEQLFALVGGVFFCNDLAELLSSS